MLQLSVISVEIAPLLKNECELHIEQIWLFPQYNNVPIILLSHPIIYISMNVFDMEGCLFINIIQMTIIIYEHNFYCWENQCCALCSEH